MVETRDDIIIDGNAATWDINEEGSIQGSYRGTFKFKCYLTPLDQIAAGRAYRELLGSNPTLVNEHESFLAYALTQLKHRVISAPPFWTSTLQSGPFSGDVPDDNIISSVLNAAIDAEAKYREMMKQKRTGLVSKSKDAAENMLEELEGTNESES